MVPHTICISQIICALSERGVGGIDAGLFISHIYLCRPAVENKLSPLLALQAYASSNLPIHSNLNENPHFPRLQEKKAKKKHER